MNRLTAAAAVTLSLGLGACAGYSPYNDAYYHAKTGAVAGAVAGGVLGHQLDDDHGRYYGAAAGALLGGMVGNTMDRQRQGHQQTLDDERRRFQDLRQQPAYPQQPYGGYGQQGYADPYYQPGHQGYNDPNHPGYGY